VCGILRVKLKPGLQQSAGDEVGHYVLHGFLNFPFVPSFELSYFLRMSCKIIHADGQRAVNGIC